MKVSCYKSLILRNIHEPNGPVYTFAILKARKCKDCKGEHMCAESHNDIASGCDNYEKLEGKEEK